MARLKAAALAALDLTGANAVFRRLQRGTIRTLLYHNVLPPPSPFANAITPAEFERHVRYLKRHYNVVGLDQAGAWRNYRSDRTNILLTFDDGFINNREHVLPILERHQVPAVFFLIADCVARGSPPSFVEPAAAADPACRTLCRADVRALQAAGMTIGSHSLSHRPYDELREEAAIEDASAAQAMLAAAVGAEVALFAFPWGRHRPGQAAVLARLHSRIFTTEHGVATPDQRVLPRNEVAPGRHLHAAASGALDFVRRAARRA